MMSWYTAPSQMVCDARNTGCRSRCSQKQCGAPHRRTPFFPGMPHSHSMRLLVPSGPLRGRACGGKGRAPVNSFQPPARSPTGQTPPPRHAPTHVKPEGTVFPPHLALLLRRGPPVSGASHEAGEDRCSGSTARPPGTHLQPSHGEAGHGSWLGRNAHGGLGVRVGESRAYSNVHLSALARALPDRCAADSSRLLSLSPRRRRPRPE